MNYYAVIGNPIAHSISPRLHNAAFNALGINGVYSRALLEIIDDENLQQNALKNLLFDLGLSGANITVPFKQTALNIANKADSLTEQIKSANTLIIEGDKISAYNTDAPGFLMAISEFSGISDALILGAGGTARAISYILDKNGVKVSILNRNENRAQAFKNYNFYTPQSYQNKSHKHDLIINTTPSGLSFAGLPFDEDLLKKAMSSAKYAYDAVYGKASSFLALSKSGGLKCKDGLDMLLFQAVLAFKLFSKNNDELSITQAMRYALKLPQIKI